MPFRVLLKQWILAKNFMRQGILLGHFLCDRVQGVERFAAHLRHFPSQVCSHSFSFRISCCYRQPTMKYAQFAHAGQTLSSGDPELFTIPKYLFSINSINFEHVKSFYTQENAQTDKSSERNLKTPLRTKKQLSTENILL